jgi:hypothetical protein
VLDGLIAQTCAEVFKSDPQRMQRVLFPDASRSKPLAQLLRV